MKFALKLTSDREKAGDLVQASYLKALVYQSQYQDNTNLRAWMFTIIKNTFINNYREQKRKGAILDYTPDLYMINSSTDKGDISPESKYNEAELLEIMKQVDPNYLVPFEMHLAGYKYKEIADKMNINVGTIKSRIFFARKSIMDIINNDKFKVNFKTSNTMSGKRTVLDCNINDVAKECIASRVTKALQEENLEKIKAARMLGLTAGANVYLSFVVNKKFWEKCPAHVWNTLQKWCNSGLTIRKYGASFDTLGETGTTNPEILEEMSKEAKHNILADLGKSEITDEHLKEKKEPVKKEKVSSKETVPATREVMDDLFAIFGDGNFMKIDPMTLNEAIELCKTGGSPLYFNDKGGCTIIRAKKLYNIVTKPVETLFE
jgi:RNA polymerase sigma-70 factor (ECF subfamily)